MAACRVVVVDDHDALRRAVVGYLQADPRFEVVAEAGDGLAAVEELVRHDCDVVLLDHSMPRATGLDALAAIRQTRPGARVVMFSSDESIRPLALAQGVDAFLSKETPLPDVADLLLGGSGGAQEREGTSL